MVGRMDGTILPTTQGIKVHPQQQVSEARVVAEGVKKDDAKDSSDSGACGLTSTV